MYTMTHLCGANSSLVRVHGKSNKKPNNIFKRFLFLITVLCSVRSRLYYEIGHLENVLSLKKYAKYNI